jgi:hypothetical protein
MGNMGRCSNSGGKYCLRRTPLNTFIRKAVARLGGLHRAVFGTMFGPKALQTLSSLMACSTSEGYVNIGSFAGAHPYARVASS